MEKTLIAEYGKVEVSTQTNDSFEFKITNGFSGNTNDTVRLMELCQKEAPEYKTIRKLVTDKNIFHLILGRNNI